MLHRTCTGRPCVGRFCGNRRHRARRRAPPARADPPPPAWTTAGEISRPGTSTCHITHIRTIPITREILRTAFKSFCDCPLSAVLGIRNILVRIRMRILGSVPLTNGSGCGSGRPKTLGYYGSGWGLGSYKTVETRNHDFSSYFCMMMEGSGSVLVTNGPGDQKTNGSYGSGSGRGSGFPTLRVYQFFYI
jgi:hypothetical protein